MQKQAGVKHVVAWEPSSWVSETFGLPYMNNIPMSRLRGVTHDSYFTLKGVRRITALGKSCLIDCCIMLSFLDCQPMKQ